MVWLRSVWQNIEQIILVRELTDTHLVRIRGHAVAEQPVNNTLLQVQVESWEIFYKRFISKIAVTLNTGSTGMLAV